MIEARKTYRHKDNPDEKMFHDKFIEHFVTGKQSLERIMFNTNDYGNPDRIATEYDETNAITLIQWLGSPVGQGFLRDCGFEKVKK